MPRQMWKQMRGWPVMLAAVLVTVAGLAYAGWVMLTPVQVAEPVVAAVIGDLCACASVGQPPSVSVIRSSDWSTPTYTAEPCKCPMGRDIRVGDKVCFQVGCCDSDTWLSGPECDGTTTVSDSIRGTYWQLHKGLTLIQEGGGPLGEPPPDFPLKIVITPQEPGGYKLSVWVDDDEDANPSTPDSVHQCDDAPVMDECSFTVVDYVPFGNLMYDRYELVADGKSVAHATYDGTESITWRIKGETYGAHVTGDGSVVAGKECGTITVIGIERGRDSCDSDIVQTATITIGASCGDSSGTPGEGKVELGSVRASIGMGKIGSHTWAGKLSIHSETTCPQLGSPKILNYCGPGEDTGEVEVIRQEDGMIRQVLSPGVLADVVVINGVGANNPTYEILMYTHEDLGAIVDGEYTILSGSQPFVKWKIDSTGLFEKYELVDDALAKVKEYNYGELNNGFQLETKLLRDGSWDTKTENVIWAARTNPDEMLRTYSVGDYSPFDETKEIWKTYPWGTRVIERRVVSRNPSFGAPATSDQVTTFGFYNNESDPDDPKNGRRKYAIYPDGSWSVWDYDSYGRTTKEITPWGDNQIQPGESFAWPTEAENVVVEYDYSSVDTSEPTQEAGDPRPRTVTRKISNQIVSKTYYAYLMEGAASNELVEIVEQAATPGAAYNGPGKMRTVTKYVPNSDERVAWIQYPDGRWDQYEYTMGTYANPDETQPGTFTEDLAGTFLRTTVRHGYSTGGAWATESGKSTRDVTITNPAGNVVLEETYTDWSASAPIVERLDWTVRVYENGRLTSSYRSDGTQTSQIADGCCGVSSRTDSTGRTTTYETDGYGRLITETQLGIVESDDTRVTADVVLSHEYNAVGDFRRGPEETKRTATLGSETISLATTYEYDGLSRVAKETDPAGLETSTSYGTTANGGRQVTVTHPNGTTEVTAYHRDGRLKTMTGTAVVPRYYTYGVEANGSQWTRVCIGSASSPRWEKTTYDMLGRKTREERPAYGGVASFSYVLYDYNDKGQLERVARNSVDLSSVPGGGAPTTIGDADTIYRYDNLGNRVTTCSDVNDDGTLNVAGSDRISETDTQYVKDTSDIWWMETVKKVYPTTGNGTAKIVGKSRRQITGLGGLAGDGNFRIIGVTESVNIQGETTTSTTLLDSNPEVRTVKQITNVLDSTTNIESITRDGLLQSSTTKEGITYTYGYDPLGRRTTVRDPRNAPGAETTTTYASNGRVEEITDAAGEETKYDYYTTAGVNKGRLKSVENSLGKKTYYSYNNQGQITNIWGHVPQPVEISYDAYGQRTSLKTYRSDPSSASWSDATWPTDQPGDETTWTYDADTGLLLAKTYEDGRHVDYDYSLTGALETRTWARGGRAGTTTYDYNDATGELTSINYSDSTPDVSFTYDRLGRMMTATDAIGTHTFSYDADSLQLAYEDIAGSLYNKRITRLYDNGSSPTGVAGRAIGFTIGTAADPDADYTTGYGYDDYGRLNLVTGAGLPADGVQYSFATNAASENVSNLVTKLEYLDQTTQGLVHRAYEANRNLLVSVENKWDQSGTMTTLSKYEYANDDIGRRTSVVTTGSAFGDTGGDAHNVWNYNDRNELTDSTRRVGTTIGSGTLLHDQYRDYLYDAIGNRTNSTMGQSPAPVTETAYTTNSVNQYTATDAPESFTYDLDGNMTQDSVYTYTYDAENRLICVAPTTPAAGQKKVESVYDYMGRRVSKIVTAWDGSIGTGGDWATVPLTVQHFVYDGWNVVLEINGMMTDNVATPYDERIARKYTWGLDLSGLSGNPSVSGIHGAGGIGGLLATAVQVGSSSIGHVYFYDGNGNVGQTLNIGNDALTARYEYDPYGNLVSILGGPFRNGNPFRFSTKYFDKELDLHGTNDGLCYYGYRFYSPRLGRWVNRDPIGEAGGPNLHGAVANSLVNLVDRRGRYPWAPGGPGQHEFLFKWSKEKQNDWLARMEYLYGPHLHAAANRHGVPEQLLKLIVANEGIDWGSREQWIEEYSPSFAMPIARSYGPAQIHICTAHNNADCFNEALYKKRYDSLDTGWPLNPDNLRRPMGPAGVTMNYLRDPEFNIDFTACLIRKYLDRLCKEAKNGKMSESFRDLIAHGCGVDDYCCLLSLENTDKARSEAARRKVSACVARTMAAVWNNGPRITQGENIAADSPNAAAHAGAINELWRLLFEEEP